MSSSKVKGDTERYNTKIQNREKTPENLYLYEIGRYPILSKEEEVEYARAVKKGERFARLTMINCNLRLVVSIAKRYQGRGMPLLDLIEEGNIGLIKAVEKFDPELGFRFSTYATHWIRQNIERELMNQTGIVRLPIHIAKELKRYKKANKELSQKKSDEVTPSDISSHLGIPIESVIKNLSFDRVAISIDAPTTLDENSSSLKDALVFKYQHSPEEKLENEKSLQVLSICYNNLDPKIKHILSRRFGLHGCNQETLEEISKDLGCSRENVRRLQALGIDKLQLLLRKHSIYIERLII